MNEKDLRALLLQQPIPDEHLALERTWETVGTAFASREPVRRRRRTPWLLLALVAILGAIGAGVVLTPAAGEIEAFVRDLSGEEPAGVVAPPAAVEETVAAPTTLVAPGELLVVSEQGVVVVDERGGQTPLGAYRGASWSPDGIFVTAWRTTELVSLDPERPDVVHWTIPGEELNDARWSSTGFRIAYRSGNTLRVTLANGTEDRELVARVAELAPAWRPGKREVLAYAGRNGRIAAVDVDTGKALWRTSGAPVPVAFAWADGKRLAVLDERRLRLFQGAGELRRSAALPDGAVGQALASRPGTPAVAYAYLVPDSGESGVVLYDSKSGDARLLFAGAGPIDNLVWSPDGEILLAGWPAAGEFVFLRVGESDVTIVTPGVEVGEGPEGFPRVDGWCCSVEGA